MDFRFTKSPHDSYAKIEVLATLTPELQSKLLEQGVAYMRAQAVDRVLVDARKVRNRAGVLDSYKLAYRETEMHGHSRTAKVALLVAPEDDSHSFVETVFQNAQFDFRIFHFLRDAVEWLSQ